MGQDNRVSRKRSSTTTASNRTKAVIVSYSVKDEQGPGLNKPFQRSSTQLRYFYSHTLHLTQVRR